MHRIDGECEGRVSGGEVIVCVYVVDDASPPLCEDGPSGKPLTLGMKPDDLLRVEFDELLVHAPALWEAESAVLVENGRQGPLLQLPQTTNQAASSMFSLVAMDQHWMISPIQNRDEGGRDLVLRNLNKRLLVAGNAKLEKGYAVVVEKLCILLGILFQDESAGRTRK